MAFRLSPDGELIFVQPRIPGSDDDFDSTLEELLERYFAEQSEDSAGRAGDSFISGATTQGITGRETIRSDESITQRTRVFLDIPTPEEFLDDFSNAFSGFAQRMVQGGLSGADLNTMLDPSSGFMQSMLGEYMGN